MRSILFISALSLLVGCTAAGTGADADTDAEATGAASAALEQGEMIIYERGRAVDDCELVDLGPPEALGGTVLEGNPELSARIDHAEGTLLAGVFQATRGKVLIHFPFTEHATILAGEVELTDESGNHHVFRPGDSYFIRQGSVILWNVKGRRVQKSFFNRVEAADAPGPMIVYERGDAVDESELVDLGPPGNLGGTVIDGNPAISARVDHADGGLLGGVFQATRGEVLIDFPFTEHATVTKGKVTLTDELGQTHTLRPGDAYLIRQNSQILWDVNGRRVQKSFLNFTSL